MNRADATTRTHRARVPSALGSRAALDEVRSRAAIQSSPLVLIDGPSGSGKSTFADAVVARWPGASPQLVRLDAIYPGWGGLDRGVEALAHAIRSVRRFGRPARVATWDWAEGATSGPVHLRPWHPLVVEGCGTFAAGVGLRALRVWVELPDGERRRRALSRDAGGFDPYWDMWERQWRRHVRRVAAETSADLRVRPTR